MERMQQRGIELRQAIETMAREATADDEHRGRPAAGAPARAAGPGRRTRSCCIAEIDELGAQFKGLELGLVDFPSEIDGQFGLLCWQYGEKEITHWHALDGGFEGRQPLPSANRRSFLQ